MSGSAKTFCLDTDEGLAVRGDLHLPRHPQAPVVVCVHGFKGFKEWGFWPEVANALVTCGFGAVRFNFSHSGIGGDPGFFTEARLFETGTYSREVEDLRLVLSHLTERRLPGAAALNPARIGLLAHSRGSVSALALAAGQEFSIGSIVLWNPVASVLWWDGETRRRWRERGFWEVVNARTGQTFRMATALLEDAERNSDRLDPVNNASRAAAPLLVVVAREDEAVPAESGRRIARAAATGSGWLLEISETGHTFGAVHPFSGRTHALEEALRATAEHFARSLPFAA